MPKLSQIRQYLLTALLVALPLERLPSLDVHGSTLRISQLLGGLLIAAALPLLWQKRSQLIRGPWVWLLAFNVISVASALTSTHRGHSLKVAVFLGFVSVLAWTVSIVFERKWLKAYAIAALAGVVATSLFGIYQFFGDLAGLPGWATGLRDSYMKGGIFPFPRIQSTALEPLYYANYLLVPLALLLLIQQFINKRVWPITLLIIVVITLSLSRGAQLAAVVIGLGSLGAGLYAKHYRRAVGVCVVGIAAVGISLGMIALGSHLYPQYGNKKNTAAASVDKFAKQATNVNQGESSAGRELTRKLALDAAKSAPVIGIGPGNFGYYAELHRPEKFNREAIVNNETLEVLAEEGLAGLLALGAFVVTLMLAALRSFKRNTDIAHRVAIGGIGLGLFGVLIQYQLFSTLYITYIWVFIGLLAGLAAPPTKVSRTSK